MLDDYQEEQVVAYNTIKNAITSGSMTHAYLIATDNSELSFNFASALAKTLICPNNQTRCYNCNECNICKRIENNNFPELKIIEPDGLWIKKDQLLELQEQFKLKPLEGSKRVYIIKQVERLNVQAANSILKFLEEPSSNIVAILTTSDIHNVLPTIISRCQIITLKNNMSNIAEPEDFKEASNKTLLKIARINSKDKKAILAFANDEANAAKLDAIVLFIKKYEAFGIDAIVNVKKSWHDYFKEKEDFTWAFDILALFYRDVLNRLYNRELDLFDHYSDVIDFVASNNNIDDIIYKVQKVLLLKEKIKYNVNLSLLMDKLILELESRELV